MLAKVLVRIWVLGVSNFLWQVQTSPISAQDFCPDGILQVVVTETCVIQPINIATNITANTAFPVNDFFTININKPTSISINTYYISTTTITSTM